MFFLLGFQVPQGIGEFCRKLFGMIHAAGGVLWGIGFRVVGIRV